MADVNDATNEREFQDPFYSDINLSNSNTTTDAHLYEFEGVYSESTPCNHRDNPAVNIGDGGRSREETATGVSIYQEPTMEDVVGSHSTLGPSEYSLLQRHVPGSFPNDVKQLKNNDGYSCLQHK